MAISLILLAIFPPTAMALLLLRRRMGPAGGRIGPRLSRADLAQALQRRRQTRKQVLHRVLHPPP